MIVLLWLMAAMAAAVLAGLTALRWLSPRRDYFFFLLMGQALIYLHIAPALAASRIETGLHSLYVLIAALSLFLFEIPVSLFYAKLMQRSEVAEGNDRFALTVSGGRTTLFAAVGIVYAAWFLWTAVTNQLLFIRLGPEGVLSRYAELPFVVWVAYRLFADTGGVLAAAMLIVTLRAPRGFVKTTAGIATLAVYASYAPFVLINNRLDSILMGAVALGVVLQWHNLLARRAWAIPVSLIGLFFMASYSYRVVNTIRENFLVFGGLRAEWFNPFYGGDANVEVKGFGSPLVMRLNGVDLMAQMTPRALREGFALGAAWQGAVAPLVLTVIDRDRANELKQRYGTDSKVYLMRRYTALSSPDYFSSALVDVYGNFGPPGILLGVLVLGGLAAFATKRMLFPVHRYSPFLGLWMMYIVLTFEQPIISTFTNFLRYAPMLALLVVLNPLRFSEEKAPELGESAAGEDG